MSIDIGTVTEILREQNVDQTVIKTVVTELQKVIADEKAAKVADTTPKAKYQYCVVVNSPTNDINNAQGWVVKMPEVENPNEILTKIQTAVARQNDLTRKGRKSPIRSIFAAFSGLKRKYTKEQSFQQLTKEPVQVIVTDGKI